MVKEQGVSFPCDYSVGEEERRKVMSAAIADARRTLPKGTVFEIRAKMYPSSGFRNYGRELPTEKKAFKDWGLAWYVSSVTPSEPLFELATDKGEYLPAGGYLLLARIVA